MNRDWDPDDRRVLECVRVGSCEICVGDRVRLSPCRRADVLDIVLRGKVATVEAIEVDVDDRCHLAVVLDDDPGAQLGFAGQVGHRFFFDRDSDRYWRQMHP
jgi:hydrogenase maturation protease